MKASESIKNRICRKIGSEAGASITFALLLFLVCAALSAVILVAATTATGRISNIAQTDQRYYAVTSASELLKDMMDGGTVSVFKVNGGEYRTFDGPMNLIKNENISMAADTVGNTDLDTPAATQTEATGLKQSVALSIINGQTVENTLKLKSDLQGDPLEVIIHESIDEGKNVTFTVEKGGYRMILMFTTDVRDAYPPVTESEDYVISDSHEVSWHLLKMLTSSDIE